MDPDLSNINQYGLRVSTSTSDLNSDIDEKSSSGISSPFQDLDEIYPIPNNELEKTIANIWQDVMSADPSTSSYNSSHSDELRQMSAGTKVTISSTYTSSPYLSVPEPNPLLI